MQIREANAGDVADIVNLFRHLSDNYGDNPAAISLAIIHRSTEIHVLENDGQIVGTAAVSFRAVPSKGLVAYIDDVIISPFLRGRGFGKMLIEYCILRARKKDCCRIELTSNPARKEANTLYQKLGFVKRNTNFYAMDI